MFEALAFNCFIPIDEIRFQISGNFGFRGTHIFALEAHSSLQQEERDHEFVMLSVLRLNVTYLVVYSDNQLRIPSKSASCEVVTHAWNPELNLLLVVDASVMTPVFTKEFGALLSRVDLITFPRREERIPVILMFVWRSRGSLSVWGEVQLGSRDWVGNALQIASIRCQHIDIEL